MKTIAKATLAGLAMMAISASSAFSQSAPQPGWIYHQTQITYKDMVKKIRAAVKAEKMGLVTRASASAGAKGRGLEIAGNMVVGVYRNDFAIRMLGASIDAGMEAPIRFYITERRDGSARLAYKKPSTVFAPYMEEGGEELQQLASELDAIFAKIAARAIK